MNIYHRIQPSRVLLMILFLLISCQTTSVLCFAQSISESIVEIKESFQEKDEPVNSYLVDKLKPIQANFYRINSKTDWTNIVQKDIYESTEGGIVRFYYANDTVEKILVRHFGETGQVLTEYYLSNEKVSFVFERQYTYNRPLYWDSLQMQQNNDTEVFDFDKSEILEDRSYFKDNILIRQVGMDCGAPNSEDYLYEEQKRILKEFYRIMKMKDE